MVVLQRLISSKEVVSSGNYMTLSDALLIEQNPWWSQPDAWEGRDPHLRRLAAQPVELPPLVAQRVPLAEPAVPWCAVPGRSASPPS